MFAYFLLSLSSIFSYHTIVNTNGKFASRGRISFAVHDVGKITKKETCEKWGGKYERKKATGGYVKNMNGGG